MEFHLRKPLPKEINWYISRCDTDLLEPLEEFPEVTSTLHNFGPQCYLFGQKQNELKIPHIFLHINIGTLHNGGLKQFAALSIECRGKEIQSVKN